MPDERRVTCALLSYFPYWPGEAVAACPGLDVVALDPSAIGAPEDRNPFNLPVDERAEVGLVSAWWHRWLHGLDPDRARRVMDEVERRVDVLIGIDGPDRFALTFPPDAMKRFALVLKPQGIYRDRELFNYVVGPQYAGAVWTEKREPRAQRYDDDDLGKLRLSIPAWVTDLPGVRRRSRERRPMHRAERVARNMTDRAADRAIGLAPARGRAREVHCLSGLSHVQRIEAVRLLDGLSGTKGIVGTQGTTAELVSGTEHGGAALPPEVASRIAESAGPYWRESMGRLAFMLDMRRHEVAVAPTGYGELTFRHGEALRAGAALVCQDVSHVELLLPLLDGHNAVFCRPDLSDLRQTVDELLADDTRRRRIARAGRRSYTDWARSWRTILERGIEAHIREAAGIKPAAVKA